MIAAQQGHEAVVASLLAAGADKDYFDSGALEMAAAKGHEAATRLLLEARYRDEIPCEEAGARVRPNFIKWAKEDGYVHG